MCVLAAWTGLLILQCLVASIASAQTFTSLYSFKGYPIDGSSPYGGSLAVSPDGSNLYGMTWRGGDIGGPYNSYGSVFSMPASGGTSTTLLSLVGSYGENPYGSVTLSPDGSTLYGMISAPAAVLVPALAIWLYAGWLSWSNWRRSARGRAVGRLECLRFLLVTLLVFTLLRPEFVQHLQRTLTPEIAVLIDASDSMKTRDLTLTEPACQPRPMAGGQTRRQFWLPLQNKAKVTVEDFAGPSTNANAINGTDLNAALERTLRDFKNLKAVLLLSDGDWNMGKSPLGTATRYREQNIPVFTVAVGRDTPMPDLILENVSAPGLRTFGRGHRRSLQSHQPSSARSQDHRFHHGRCGEAASKQITIPPNGEVEDAILWSPRTGGRSHRHRQAAG